jgi:heptosyltransferase-2
MKFYKADCSFFSGEKPCAPNKSHGAICISCTQYQPISMCILIIKLAAVGDVLRTTAILPALKSKYPKSSIWWITAPQSKDILKKNPYIDLILDTNANFFKFVKFSIAFNFDMSREASAILMETQASIKKGFSLSKYGSVIPADSKSERWFKMGITDEIKKKNTKTYQEHIFYISGLSYKREKPQINLDLMDRQKANHFYKKFKLNSYKKILGLNIGAGTRWPMKKWTFDGFVYLAKKIKNKYPNVGILIYGGPDEQEIIPKYLKTLKDKVISTGTDNSLREFAALVDLCQVLVTGDTLALHIGVALNKRVVAYFGPTADAEIDLYDRGEKLRSEILCPDFYMDKCSQQFTCMDHLTGETVFKSVERQLNFADQERN